MNLVKPNRYVIMPDTNVLVTASINFHYESSNL